MTQHMVQSSKPSGDQISSQVRRDLRASIGDAVGYSFTVGLGEAYIAAFALAVGMGEVVTGLVATLPMLLGSVLQLMAPGMARALGSLRRWVLICAVVQSLSLVPLGYAAWHGRISAPVLLLIVTLYWAANLSTGPAWNTWIGTLVPKPIRANYFALRSRFAQVAVLIGLAVAGLSLHYGKQQDRTLTVFCFLFLAAAMCRLISAWFLSRHSEPQPIPKNYRMVPFKELLGRVRSAADGRLLGYMITVQVCVQVSGPFFTPYMLGRLQFSYMEYLMLIAGAFVSKIIAFPLLGRFADRYGASALLWFSGVGIVPLSAFWIVSDQLVYLLVLQVFAGAIWAGYELATFLLLFDHIAEHERTSILTVFNFANALAMVGGSLLGGTVLGVMGEVIGSYHVVFVMSGVARLGTLFFLRGLVSPASRPKMIRFDAFFPRILAVRPSLGSLDRPLLPEVDQADEDGESLTGDEPERQDKPAALRT
ncbi:MAG: MFS transporter [Planctomycetes bacterium]|nr:MFS transporter [Planctomycetota bacterium]NOG52991.1 MFS transporter [Planctomycetota bacterium]